MKTVTIIYVFIAILTVYASTALAQNGGSTKATASAFEERARQYAKRREEIESGMPALPKKATAEQVTAHKSLLIKKVLQDREAATRGQIFTPDSERMIRSIIAAQYPGRDGTALRKELAEAENKTVPIKVNALYPESAELLEMPPPLLLALPNLPKQVRYRFVGTNLLIVDRESHLIVDFMTNALP